MKKVLLCLLIVLLLHSPAFTQSSGSKADTNFTATPLTALLKPGSFKVEILMPAVEQVTLAETIATNKMAKALSEHQSWLIDSFPLLKKGQPFPDSIGITREEWDAFLKKGDKKEERILKVTGKDSMSIFLVNGWLQFKGGSRLKAFDSLAVLPAAHQAVFRKMPLVYKNKAMLDAKKSPFGSATYSYNFEYEDRSGDFSSMSMTRVSLNVGEITDSKEIFLVLLALKLRDNKTVYNIIQIVKLHRIDSL